MKEREIRSFGGNATPQVVEGRTIEGYAVVFNSESNVLYDPVNKRMFTETIKPESITSELLMRSDVKALIEHNKSRLLARSNKGVGTLTLSIDARGVKYSFEAPNTTDGNDLLEMVSRGDISGSSFAFAVPQAGAVWSKRANGFWHREIKAISGFFDVSVTADPAFSETNVSVRSIEELEVPDKEKELTYNQKAELLGNALRKASNDDTWVSDFDSAYIYAYYYADKKTYKIPYTMGGGEITFDFDSKVEVIRQFVERGERSNEYITELNNLRKLI